MTNKPYITYHTFHLPATDTVVIANYQTLRNTATTSPTTENHERLKAYCAENFDRLTELFENLLADHEINEALIEQLMEVDRRAVNLWHKHNPDKVEFWPDSTALLYWFMSNTVLRDDVTQVFSQYAQDFYAKTEALCEKKNSQGYLTEDDNKELVTLCTQVALLEDLWGELPYSYPTRYTKARLPLKAKLKRLLYYSVAILAGVLLGVNLHYFLHHLTTAKWRFYAVLLATYSLV